MTVTCPHCGEQIDAEDFALSQIKFQYPDPLEPLFRKMNRTGYYSNENGQQTVAKAEPILRHSRAKFRQP